MLWWHGYKWEQHSHKILTFSKFSELAVYPVFKFHTKCSAVQVLVALAWVSLSLA